MTEAPHAGASQPPLPDPAPEGPGGRKKVAWLLAGLALVAVSVGAVAAFNSSGDASVESSRPSQGGQDRSATEEDYSSVINSPVLCSETLLPLILEAADTRDPNVLVYEFGLQSPVYQPASDLMAGTVMEQYNFGARAAVDFATAGAVDMCLDPVVVNHVLGLREGDPGWWDPETAFEFPERTPGNAGSDGDAPQSAGPESAPPSATSAQVTGGRSIDDVVAEMESSPEVPANNQWFVASQLFLAMERGDAGLFAGWAEFPMPADVPVEWDRNSLSCDEGFCTMTGMDGRKVAIVLDYSDRGWYGIETFID